MVTAQRWARRTSAVAWIAFAAVSLNVGLVALSVSGVVRATQDPLIVEGARLLERAFVRARDFPLAFSEILVEAFEEADALEEVRKRIEDDLARLELEFRNGAASSGRALPRWGALCHVRVLEWPPDGSVNLEQASVTPELELWTPEIDLDALLGFRRQQLSRMQLLDPFVDSFVTAQGNVQWGIVFRKEAAEGTDALRSQGTVGVSCSAPLEDGSCLVALFTEASPNRLSVDAGDEIEERWNAALETLAEIDDGTLQEIEGASGPREWDPPPSADRGLPEAAERALDKASKKATFLPLSSTADGWTWARLEDQPLESVAQLSTDPPAFAVDERTILASSWMVALMLGVLAVQYHRGELVLRRMYDDLPWSFRRPRCSVLLLSALAVSCALAVASGEAAVAPGSNRFAAPVVTLGMVLYLVLAKHRYLQAERKVQ